MGWLFFFLSKQDKTEQQHPPSLWYDLLACLPVCLLHAATLGCRPRGSCVCRVPVLDRRGERALVRARVKGSTGRDGPSRVCAAAERNGSPPWCGSGSRAQENQRRIRPAKVCSWWRRGVGRERERQTERERERQTERERDRQRERESVCVCVCLRVNTFHTRTNTRAITVAAGSTSNSACTSRAHGR